MGSTRLDDQYYLARAVWISVASPNNVSIYIVYEAVVTTILVTTKPSRRLIRLLPKWIATMTSSLRVSLVLARQIG
jgi:hypothetical protein